MQLIRVGCNSLRQFLPHNHDFKCFGVRCEAPSAYYDYINLIWYARYKILCAKIRSFLDENSAILGEFRV